MILNIKELVILGLFSVFTFSAFSQFAEVQNEPAHIHVDRKGKMEFGLEHTLSFSSLIGNGPKTSFGVTETKFDPVGVRVTMSLGGFGNYYITDKMSFQFEFMFAFSGSHFKLDKTIYQDLGYFTTTTNKTYALRYVKVPLTLNYYLLDNFYFQGGGYFSALLNAKSRENHVVFGPKSEFVDNLNPVDLGVIGGVGFDARIIKLGFRYSYGFSNVFSNSGDAANLHNSVFEVIAHWKLNKKN